MVSRTSVHRLHATNMTEDVEARVALRLLDLFVEQLRIQELYAMELGVQPADLRAFELIAEPRSELLSMGRLASLLRLSTGAVTGTVDRLEASGLVERLRDAEDRRRVLLRITAQAERMTEAFFERYVKGLSETLRAFEPHELSVCERLLGAVACALAND